MSNQINVTAEIVENRKYLMLQKLNSFRGRGRPATIQELRERLDGVFQWCGEHDILPNIELLSAAVGVTTRTFQRWCNGLHCSEQWQDICLQARQLVIASLADATVTGTVSPPVGIFLLKSHGYSDTRSLESQAIGTEYISEERSYMLPGELIQKYQALEDKNVSETNLRPTVHYSKPETVEIEQSATKTLDQWMTIPDGFDEDLLPFELEDD